MAEAMVVFVAGIGGVFLGMAYLYIAIKIVSEIMSRLDEKEAGK